MLALWVFTTALPQVHSTQRWWRAAMVLFTLCAPPPVVPRIVSPPPHQAVLGEHTYLCRGQASAMQSQWALQLIISFASYWCGDVLLTLPCLRCTTWGTDISGENETVLSTLPNRLFACCPCWLWHMEVEGAVNIETNQIIGRLWLWPTQLGDV